MSTTHDQPGVSVRDNMMGAPIVIPPEATPEFENNVVRPNDQQQNRNDMVRQIDESFIQQLGSMVDQDEIIPGKPGKYTPLDKPVDLRITDKTKQMIWDNKYVDFFSLLDPTMTDADGYSLVYNPGKPISLASQKAKSINSFRAMVLCF